MSSEELGLLAFALVNESHFLIEPPSEFRCHCSQFGAPHRSFKRPPEFGNVHLCRGERLSAPISPQSPCGTRGKLLISFSFLPSDAELDRPEVDCKPGPVPARGPARIIHLGDALPRRSSTLTRTLGSIAPIGRATLDSVPIRACSGRGLPRRRSPGCRAWALTPRFHPYLCAASGETAPSAVSFLWRFPSGHPGSALPTSQPCGARTFLPRAMLARRRSSVHLRPREARPPRAERNPVVLEWM